MSEVEEVISARLRKQGETKDLGLDLHTVNELQCSMIQCNIGVTMKKILNRMLCILCLSSGVYAQEIIASPNFSGGANSWTIVSQSGPAFGDTTLFDTLNDNTATASQINDPGSGSDLNARIRLLSGGINPGFTALANRFYNIRFDLVSNQALTGQTVKYAFANANPSFLSMTTFSSGSANSVGATTFVANNVSSGPNGINFFLGWNVAAGGADFALTLSNLSVVKVPELNAAGAAFPCVLLLFVGLMYRDHRRALATVS